MKQEIGESEKPFGTTESDWLGRSVSGIYACEVLVYVHIVNLLFITSFPFFSHPLPFFISYPFFLPLAMGLSAKTETTALVRFQSPAVHAMRDNITLQNPVFSHLFLPSFFRFATVR